MMTQHFTSAAVKVTVIRNGKYIEVPFCGVKSGDIVASSGTVVDGDSHFSGDASYDG